MDCCGCRRCWSASARSGLCQRLEVSHAQRPQPSPPPPSVAPIDRCWAQLPARNRQRLLWLLSQLLERHLLTDVQRKEAGHDHSAGTCG
jgi:hypothetical protein